MGRPRSCNCFCRPRIAAGVIDLQNICFPSGPQYLVWVFTDEFGTLFFGNPELPGSPQLVTGAGLHIINGAVNEVAWGRSGVLAVCGWVRRETTGGRDGWVVLYEPDSVLGYKVRWSKRIGQELTGCAVDLSGNVLIVGGRIAKFDASGEMLWEVLNSSLPFGKQINGPARGLALDWEGYSYLTSLEGLIKYDPDGNFDSVIVPLADLGGAAYIAVDYDGSIATASRPNISATVFDSEGNQEWKSGHLFGSPFNDNSTNCVAFGPNSEVVVGGVSVAHQPGDQTTRFAVPNLRYFEADGEDRWNYAFNKPDLDTQAFFNEISRVRGVCVDRKGNTYCAGDFNLLRNSDCTIHSNTNYMRRTLGKIPTDGSVFNQFIWKGQRLLGGNHIRPDIFNTIASLRMGPIDVSPGRIRTP